MITDERTINNSYALPPKKDFLGGSAQLLLIFRPSVIFEIWGFKKSPCEKQQEKLEVWD